MRASVHTSQPNPPQPRQKSVAQGIEHERAHGFEIVLCGFFGDQFKRLRMLLSEARPLEVAATGLEWAKSSPLRASLRVPSGFLG